MRKSAVRRTNERSSIEDQHRLLFQAWSCAFAGLPVVYVSGPITTGPRFVHWYQRAGRELVADTKQYEAEHRSAVIEPNERELIEITRRLRLELREPVVEPASLRVSEWSQEDYLGLWEQFIEKHAGKLVMAPGWHFSAGCAAEFVHAVQHSIPIQTPDGQSVAGRQGLLLLREAAAVVRQLDLPIAKITRSLEKLELLLPKFAPNTTGARKTRLRKDASLDHLADSMNVAQFVSFEPMGSQPKQAYARILGYEANYGFASVRTAIEELLRNSVEHSVNVRSFTPESPLSREFIYGLSSADDALAAVNRLTAQGLNTIVNETVNVRDGGVSGVLLGDVIEFSPDDTPRCVEKPGLASLPRRWGVSLLETVYRFPASLDVSRESRLEFSLHPQPRGWRNTHTLTWEYAEAEDVGRIEAKLVWPNNFSRMIGDKVFGLLVAHHLGLPVPHTTVVNRRVAPFSFGQPTGRAEVLLRTSPSEQVPGKFTTTRGWVDPFELLAREDSSHLVASVIAQAEVGSAYSGAAIVTANEQLLIEGKSGHGESFMRGDSAPEHLPDEIRFDVAGLFEHAYEELGPVRFEWVHDGRQAWIVQLHRGATQSVNDVLVPGEPARWRRFDVSEGLEKLRELLNVIGPDEGILLSGRVGLTSHIADVIRRSGVPARMAL